MKIKKTFSTLILLPILCLIPISTSFSKVEIEVKNDPKSVSVYEWFTKLQSPSGLVATREGKEGICFVYDQALAVYLFLLFDDIERAEKVLNFFNTRYQEQIEKGHFIGFVDMYFSTGASGATYRAGGPNAWLLNAINEYTYRTGKKTYLPLATTLADWLIELQAIDGGMMGGHHPHLHFISTEHNADAYAALKNFYFLTSKPIYAEKAEEFKNWLLEVAYIPSDKRFGNGKNDINYALDTSSWTVLALGKEVEHVLDIAETVAQCSQYYEFKNCNVEGFDFGGPYWDTPYPDKDAVWFEGTAQMIIAYQAVGNEEKANHFLNEIEKCLTESTYHPGTFGLPYASNAGTPAYGGWQMTNNPLCASSSAWYVFAKARFNPFNFKGELLHNFKEFPWPPKDINPVEYVKKQFKPTVDDFEGTQAQISTSYPLDQVESQHCIFNHNIEFNQTARGKKALRLLFIPRNITDARGEFISEEIYNFEKEDGPPVILTTSSQPESITDDDERVFKKVPQTEEIKTEKNKSKESLALFSRKFLTPQDWKDSNNLNFYLKHDNSTNFFFLRLKDAKGKTWVSEPIALVGKGWKQHKLDINKTNLSKNEITEIGFGLRSGSPTMESVIYLDEITLN